MKVVRAIILILVAVGIIGGLGYYKYINTVTYYNDPGTNGNTIGNLYGNGLFCETDGVVYFANPNDNDRIYKMNPDETAIDIVANDSIYFLNADSHYLYYSRNGKKYRDYSQMGFLNVNTDSLCRMTKKNGKVKILDDAICNALSLAGNRIVYFHYDADEATTVYKVNIDGTQKEQLSTSQIDPRCMVGEKLYYSGVEHDHNLHRMNLDTKDSAFVSAENLWLPIVTGDDVYYMNLDDKNRVYKSSLSGDNKVGITTYGASNYNIDGNYLYYQSIKGNPDGLYRVDLTSGATFHVAIGSTEIGLFDPPIIPLDD